MPRAVTRALLPVIGLAVPPMRGLVENLYIFYEPYVVDHSAYAAAFGDDATPLREAIRQTVAWARSHTDANTRCRPRGTRDSAFVPRREKAQHHDVEQDDAQPARRAVVLAGLGRGLPRLPHRRGGGHLLVGPIETVGTAAIAGAVAGAAIGAAQWLVLRRRLPLSALWVPGDRRRHGPRAGARPRAPGRRHGHRCRCSCAD